MKILILSFYYPPDLSAGSFRVASLIEAFAKNRDTNLEIDIITTQPNRYAEVACQTKCVEDYGWLRVRRISLPKHDSGMKDQAKAFTVYAKQVLRISKNEKWDLVFASSSRLMTAALGAYISKKQKTPLYLDVRDLFHDTMGDVLKNSRIKYILPIFKSLEKWTFKTASKINVVSAGFSEDLEQIAPVVPYSTFTNGIDDPFLDYDFKKKPVSEKNLPVLLYAGNIGEGQGLHNIIPDIAKAFNGRLSIKIVGNGGRFEKLKASLSEDNKLINGVELAPPVRRSNLLEEYKNADILFLHLNNYDAFKKVLPSKIFEYAATGKPILAGVSGYSAEFLKKKISNSVVFEPCNSDEMILAVEKILLLPNHVDRRCFCEAYRRTNIMNKMVKDILLIA